MYARRVLIGLTACVLAAFTFADKIVKSDGTEIEGRIVTDDDLMTVIEVDRDGRFVRLPVAKAAIAKIVKGPATTTASSRPATSRPTTQELKDAEERRAKYAADRVADKAAAQERYEAIQAKKAEEKRIAQERRAAYFSAHNEEITRLRAELDSLRARGLGEEKTLNDLIQEEAYEVRIIEDEYRTEVRKINGAGYNAATRNVLERRAREIRDRKNVEIRNRFQPQIADARAAVNKTLGEMLANGARAKAIADAAPKVPR